MGRRVLFVSYHFPPIQTSSGVHRVLAFSRYLKDHDWDVTVLTVGAKAYSSTRDENLELIPDHVSVVRSFALETRRHLSIKGRYSGWMALPDQWQSWIVWGGVSGLRTIWRERPNVILSTYPIASAHCIAYLLHRVTGIPWVADLRDPMAQDDYPSDPVVWKCFSWIEKKIFRYASRVTVTTEGTAELYRNRYEAAAGKVVVIPNGFDEGCFSEIDNKMIEGASNVAKVTLLHSGLLYPKERDPTNFFKAIADLKNEGHIDAKKVEIILRSSGNEEDYQQCINRLGIDDVVYLKPSVPYKEAVSEMLSVDGLLILQANNCNQQIPAKIYEYIYACKPILGLTTLQGDTGRLLQELGVPTIAALEDAAQVKIELNRFIQMIVDGSYLLPEEEKVKGYSRKSGVATLAKILNEVGQ